VAGLTDGRSGECACSMQHCNLWSSNSTTDGATETSTDAVASLPLSFGRPAPPVVAQWKQGCLR
jgi:hypothetical protein